ncbi:hypothetical protein SARC_09350 [Sphaeroforma arctica JP610]|uniref:Uncharacterized protein n=1 Tax=Sphaeroforma arctica JP610 TaxID=667725 RepID=A0A0L0FN50_9EUKA|nr:hypothetical protein SARC_09350 [Sphaeroforma arctica JP610]KNC78210.1 hypothetical protein SARC_09350 [Sphaeroforma arctica JP610]|eukprot:XP_014152112.1 hypothetical protein SARC_09350 [Sphaeroforma arctica JP610]
MVQELAILRTRDPDSTITEFDRFRTVQVISEPKNNTRPTVRLFENVDHGKDVLDVPHFTNRLTKATANIWDLFGINRSVMLHLAHLVIVLDPMTEPILSLIPRLPHMGGLDVSEVRTDISQFDSIMNRYKRQGKPIPNTPSLLDACRDSYQTLTDSKTYPNLVGTWKRYVDMGPMYYLCHGWMKDVVHLRRAAWRFKLVSNKFWTEGRVKRPDTTSYNHKCRGLIHVLAPDDLDRSEPMVYFTKLNKLDYTWSHRFAVDENFLPENSNAKNSLAEKSYYASLPIVGMTCPAPRNGDYAVIPCGKRIVPPDGNAARGFDDLKLYIQIYMYHLKTKTYLRRVLDLDLGSIYYILQ